jgi:hypothetical protein
VSTQINYPDYQKSGLRLRWECPRGHDEEDETPLARLAYCTTCGTLYEWSEVERRGPVTVVERVSAQEARL